MADKVEKTKIRYWYRCCGTCQHFRPQFSTVREAKRGFWAPLVVLLHSQWGECDMGFDAYGHPHRIRNHPVFQLVVLITIKFFCLIHVRNTSCGQSSRSMQKSVNYRNGLTGGRESDRGAP